eukprot:gene38324-64377_t
MLITEVIAYVFYVSNFFYFCSHREMGCGTATDFIEAVNQSLLPGVMLVFMIVWFMIIIADRIIYLMRATRSKYMLQVILSVFYHISYLILPEHTDNGAVALACFFCVKWVYLSISALQLRSGFPAYSRADFFTHRVTGCENLPRCLMLWFFYGWYMGIRAVPFIWELRMLLDWSCAHTTLKL